MKLNTITSSTNTNTAITISNSSPISQSQGGERRTQDSIDFTKNNIPLTNRDIASIDTSKPGQHTNEEKLKLVIEMIDVVLKVTNYPLYSAADILFLQGKTFRCQGDALINHLSSLLCFEKSLSIYLAVKPIDHTKLIEIYIELGHVYKDLKDINKAFDCYKKAYWLNGHDLSKYNVKISHQLSSAMKSLHNYHVILDANPRPCMILLYGEVDLNLVLLKQKIQTVLLDPIAYAIEKDYGWSYIRSFTGSECGVKGYINRDYVKTKLKELGELEKEEKEETEKNKKKIELAQMLCFEAMNLAILKIKKSNAAVSLFTKENRDLIIKIENEHPEFFVDKSIVDDYKNEMSGSKTFSQSALMKTASFLQF
ncbi:MAG: hypothetical protein C5B43_04060 [Verrucomicrobia bacterium]|nr:MAG: hypothetical protein C5B43_04060 [Verrucomicrobiota bacterium]